MVETRVRWLAPWEKEKATPPALAWRIPGLQRNRHEWVTFTHYRLLGCSRCQRQSAQLRFLPSVLLNLGWNIYHLGTLLSLDGDFYGLRSHLFLNYFDVDTILLIPGYRCHYNIANRSPWAASTAWNWWPVSSSHPAPRAKISWPSHFILSRISPLLINTNGHIKL